MTMRRLRAVLRQLTGGVLFALSVTLFVAVVLWDRVAITVPAGSGGVMWYRFFGGTVDTPGPPLREGFHVIFPWDKIYVYELRIQSQDEVYEVVSSDGLHFKVALSFRWEPFPRNLGILHRKFGPDYVQSLLTPEIGSETRHAISNYTANDMVTGQRAVIENKIFINIVSDGLPNGIGSASNSPDTTNVIQVDNILIKNVILPEQIRVAIENKLEQAQIVEEYQFRVARERLESERKAVEADGIRRFQETVAPAITESYLRWRGIEATLQLSQSPNSKVVIIGSPGGLPIILDGVDRKSEPALPGAAAEPARPVLQLPQRQHNQNLR